MNKKIFLVLSIIQFAIGFLTTLSFVVLAIGGEKVSQYIPTLVLAVIFVIMGIVGMIRYKRDKQ